MERKTESHNISLSWIMLYGFVILAPCLAAFFHFQVVVWGESAKILK